MWSVLVAVPLLSITAFVAVPIVLLRGRCRVIRRTRRRPQQQGEENEEGRDGDQEGTDESRRRRRRRRRGKEKRRDVLVMGFFHPYCSGGGGGERVLWKMIQDLGGLCREDLFLRIVVYTVDEANPTYKQDIVRHVKDRFSIDLSTESIREHVSLEFVHLNQHKRLLEPSGYFSLVVESIGTMRLAYQALRQSLLTTTTTSSTTNDDQDDPSPSLPDIYVDTTGCAFTYVVASLLFGCRVLAYVHYPTISTDMLQRVWEQRKLHHPAASGGEGDGENGGGTGAAADWKRTLKTYVKLVYYVMFAVAYGAVGSLSTLVMVNSTWTYNHIASLWRIASRRDVIRIVYPPCLLATDRDRVGEDGKDSRLPVVLSIGQFRPEKDHALQLYSFARLLAEHPELKATTTTTTTGTTTTTSNSGDNRVQLVLIGSCRGPSDEKRLRELQALTRKLDLIDHVKFVVNQKYSVIQDWLTKASVGIHTMWNEHFGIGIVEMMSAGLIVVAHRSGGPESDIVTPVDVPSPPSCPSSEDAAASEETTKTTTTKVTPGFLAATAEEYADAMHRALTMDDGEAAVVRSCAKKSASRFSDDVFALSFQRAVLDSNILAT